MIYNFWDFAKVGSLAALMIVAALVNLGFRGHGKPPPERD